MSYQVKTSLKQRLARALNNIESAGPNEQVGASARTSGRPDAGGYAVYEENPNNLNERAHRLKEKINSINISIENGKNS